MYPATVPLELQGVDTTTLQSWLRDAQLALQQLTTGSNVTTVSYAQGEGQRSVTYTRTDRPALVAWIGSLQRALGNAPPRRAYQVGFGRPW